MGNRSRSRKSAMVVKHKWRKGKGDLYHCYDRAFHNPFRYESLCGLYTIKVTHGQVCGRPDSRLRCAQCDIEEMKILGLEESADPSRRK